LLAAPSAGAAAPQITESFVTEVTATSANLRALINPNGAFTTYRFEYVTQAAFEQSGYATAKKAPPSGESSLGAGTTALAVTQHLSNLTPATAYRYRALAFNQQGSATDKEHVLTTQEVSLTFRLPDSRGWEMVSPIDKGGGAIAAPGAIFGGGDSQAAPSTAAVTYGSATSFGDAQGAPPGSQYLSTRTPSGWITQNVSAPIESGAYGDHPDGAPYRLFSTDLSQGLLFGGLACRAEIEGCPQNPVLVGSGAPPAHMAYYLRSSATGAFASLLTSADLSHTAVLAKAFEVAFVAASPDLSHVLLSSCAALSANATEVPDGPEGCDAEEQNLYLRSSSGLSLVNLLPGDSTGTPGAEIAAPLGAVSSNGSRVYWTREGKLFLREGSQTFEVGEAEGGAFEAASADGAVAFFSNAGHLHRFLATTKAVTDLTPAGGVVGVLGASEDGSTVYYQDAAGIERWREGTIAQVVLGASAAAAGAYPPSTGTSHVSPDGSHLAFLSGEELTSYDNGGAIEAYLYGPPPGGGAPQLICASCNPTGERAAGSASIPAAQLNGSTRAYRPRALSTDGSRLLFESDDELVLQDSNSHPDVYQWEAKGKGDCQRSPGCLNLISSGRAPQGATFIDASADGTDVYFITDESLVSTDPGSIDLYDARAGGGFLIPPKPVPCIADACQSLPPTPEDPDPGTLVKNPGNPPSRFEKEKKRKKQHKKQHHKGKGKGKGKDKGKGKFHVPLKRSERFGVGER
jgi:hypothetical protein